MIAVAGTLAGSVLTHVFGRWNAERAERVARHERWWQDRTEAVLHFSEIVTGLRRAAYDRWHRQHDGSADEIVGEAVNEYYRLRASAEHAFLKVRVHANDRELISAGREALDEVLAVHRSEDYDEIAMHGCEAQRRIDHFVEIASASAPREAVDRA